MTVSNQAGIGRSAIYNGTIPDGGTFLSEPIDLLRPYAFAVIRIPDCSNIASSSSLNLQLGETTDDSMCDEYDRNAGSADIVSLPTSGSFRYVVPIMGARRIKPGVSVATDGDVDIQVFGIDPVVGA